MAHKKEPDTEQVAQPSIMDDYKPTVSDDVCTPDKPCMHCQSKNQHKVPLVINHGPYKSAGELADNEVNRVSLPGDLDYTGYFYRSKQEIS